MSDYVDTINGLRQLAERAAADAPRRPRVRTVDAAIEEAAASLKRRDRDIAMLIGDYNRYAQHGAWLCRYQIAADRLFGAKHTR